MINIISGINFFVDSLNIDYSNIPAAFSFRSNPTTNTNIVYPDLWASGSSSGILPNIGGDNFFTYSGTGYFNGNNYFKLSKNYSLNNSLIFLSYEKLRNADEILLSSVTGSSFATYSGFYVGVNNANKLYLKYWNNIEGVFTFTYTGTLSDKNIIIISRNDSIITLGHFNNNTFKISSQNFEIFQNNFINSSELYIGGSPIQPRWGSTQLSNFSGYFDRFYIFNNIPFVYSNILSRGLFSEPTGFAGDLNEFCYTTGFLSGSGFFYNAVTGVSLSGFQSGTIGITGYTQTPSGYFYSGVTGYSGKFIGFYVDNCGVNIDIIEQVPLSGQIYEEILVTTALTGIVFTSGFVEIELTGLLRGTENVFITGVVCDSFFNNFGEVLYAYDENYLSELSYKEISLLSTVSPLELNSNTDVVEIYTEQYKPKTLEYNRNLIYDNLNENYFYIDKEFAPNEVLMFGNGQALIDSGYQLIPSGYEILRSPNLDYFITGTTVETNKFFGTIDSLFYDYFSGRFWAIKNTGNIINIPADLSSNYWVFRNGQKLISGKDYNKIFNTLTLVDVNSFEDNYIIFKEILNNNIYQSGNVGSIKLTGKFNHDCSQVYFNGFKQKIQANYIENSTYDLLSGTFNEPNKSQEVIYNNTDDFFV
jgi:hypothetical protein